MKKFNHTISKIFLIILILITQSCIELFNPKLETIESKPLLVVEGHITNQEGPFRVRLNESASLYNDPNKLYQDRPVYGASLQISDDKGNTHTLYETNNGWYETESKKQKTKIGNSYVLTIITADGVEYTSSPVLVLDVPEIEKVHYSESVQTIFDKEYPYDINLLSIMVNSKNFKNGIGYLKWEFEETWQFELPTVVKVDHGTDETSPPPSIETVSIEPERKYCWASEPSMSTLISSTANNTENEINDFVLQTISPPDDNLNIKYSILVKQYALTRELYLFFKKLRESNEDTGGMYDKNPSQVIGNIHCCNNETKALGYFFASSVETKRIFINRSEHSVPKGSAYRNCGWTTSPPRYQKSYRFGKDKNGNNIYSTNFFCTDCRARGTDTKPDFWE